MKNRNHNSSSTFLTALVAVAGAAVIGLWLAEQTTPVQTLTRAQGLPASAPLTAPNAAAPTAVHAQLPAGKRARAGRA